MVYQSLSGFPFGPRFDPLGLLLDPLSLVLCLCFDLFGLSLYRVSLELLKLQQPHQLTHETQWRGAVAATTETLGPAAVKPIETAVKPALEAR